MSLGTALLIVLVLAAALACPAMMWFQGRRGRTAACCAPGPDKEPARSDTLEGLRAEHARVTAELAELQSDSASPSRGGQHARL